jgi:hypothetical protein
LAGCCECGDEPSGCGAKELVSHDGTTEGKNFERIRLNTDAWHNIRINFHEFLSRHFLLKFVENYMSCERVRLG